MIVLSTTPLRHFQRGSCIDAHCLQTVIYIYRIRPKNVKILQEDSKVFIYSRDHEGSMARALLHAISFQIFKEPT